MRDILLGAMLVLSVLIIIVVALQPTKTQNSSNAFMGGGKENINPSKPRGFEAFLQRSTIVLGTAFFFIAIWIATIS